MVSQATTTTHELVLTNGERRPVTLPAHTGSIGNALSRFDDWIETDDGAWVQKSFVVEVRPVEEAGSVNRTGSDEEMRALADASGELADEARS